MQVMSDKLQSHMKLMQTNDLKKTNYHEWLFLSLFLHNGELHPSH